MTTTSLTYPEWLRHFEPDASTLDVQRRVSQSLAHRPHFSVILAAGEAPADDGTRANGGVAAAVADVAASLGAALDQVLAQTYDRWDLVVLDLGLEGAAREMVETRIARDPILSEPRIRLLAADPDESLPACLNRAAATTNGEWLVFIDQDDALAPNALYEIAIAAGQAAPRPGITAGMAGMVDVAVEPDAAGLPTLVYSDADASSFDGAVRGDPLIKPEWSPELLIAANYIGRFAVGRNAFDELNGFDVSREGGHEWDFLLRCVEQHAVARRVPRFLFHRRTPLTIPPASPSADVRRRPAQSDEDQMMAKVTAVADHLRRRGVSRPDVRPGLAGDLRVLWHPDVLLCSIVIPTKNAPDLIRTCVTSILQLTTEVEYEVLLVDNDSTDPATLAFYEQVTRDPRVRIVPNPGPFNFSVAVNRGVAASNGDAVLLLNNDMQVLETDWLARLTQWLTFPEIGVVSALLLYPAGLIQHAGLVVGLLGNANHVFGRTPLTTYGPFGSPHWYRNYLALTGACQLIRRSTWERLGGYDEAYTLIFSDVEFCLRAYEAGFRNMYTADTRIVHVESMSRGQTQPPGDLRRAWDRLEPVVQRGDPYFNPNLSHLSLVPAFRFPTEKRVSELVEDLLRRLGV